MIGIEIDVSELKERGVIAEIPQGMKLDIIYNNMDDFIYVGVLDKAGEIVTGHTKLVPNIDIVAMSRNEIPWQIRCIKVNEYAEERDKITVENLNHDYKFFMIGVEENEVV